MNKLSKENIPFTQVANHILYDPELSLKSKGLFAYLFSKPEGWNFAVDRIAKEHSDGRTAIEDGLKELERGGYLIRRKLGSGRTLYILQFSEEEPTAGNLQKGQGANCRKPATAGNLQLQETCTISNTEIISNTDKESNTDIRKAISDESRTDPKQISELIDCFKPINPMINFGHKTHRKAASDLIEALTFEKALTAAQIAAKAQGMPYSPVITTPSQLKTKLGELRAFVAKESAKGKQFTIIKV